MNATNSTYLDVLVVFPGSAFVLGYSIILLYCVGSGYVKFLCKFDICDLYDRVRLRPSNSQKCPNRFLVSGFSLF